MDSRVSYLFHNVIISSPPCRCKLSDRVSLKTNKIYIVVKKQIKFALLKQIKFTLLLKTNKIDVVRNKENLHC